MTCPLSNHCYLVIIIIDDKKVVAVKDVTDHRGPFIQKVFSAKVPVLRSRGLFYHSHCRDHRVINIIVINCIVFFAN